MKTIVLGLGISGKAVSRYLRQRGDSVIGVDRAVESIDGMTVVHESSPIQLDGVDLLVKSPGIALTHPWVQAAQLRGVPIVGEIDLALSELEARKKIVLGVTGSNGKTTTTLMATHLLNKNGKKAVAAGNVGIPLIEQIHSDADVFVVEFSSFQLEQIVENKILDAAVILNITPNHLDRHASFEAYVEAKLRILLCLKPQAPLYLSSQVMEMVNLYSNNLKNLDLLKEKVETILSLGYRDSQYRLFPHDVENASAAYALSQIPIENLREGIATFVRPAHRLEFVREINGVAFINDSKATSVDAVIKAVQALHGPLVLIAGGVDKGGVFSDWRLHFMGKVKKVMALGQAADRIAKELSPEIAVEKVSSLKEGVCKAAAIACKGYTVLLSPGCSSYDQFKDYQHRGETFRQIIEEIL